MRKGKYALYGGASYFVGVTQFFIAIIVAAISYGPPPYNPVSDSISDLQAVHCGIFQGSEVCSPMHLLANSSLAAVGSSLVIGTVLIRSSFPESNRRNLAIGLLIVAGMASFANAFTPEDVTFAGDIITAIVIFLTANFALIQIGRLMLRDTKWKRFGLFSENLGIIGVASLILDGTGISGATGLVEWLIVAPILIWMFAVAVHLFRRPSAQRLMYHEQL